MQLMHVYEVRPRKDKRGVDLISDALPFGRLWYVGANAVSNAIGYAKFFSRSHDALIRVFRASIKTAEQNARRPFQSSKFDVQSSTFNPLPATPR